MLATDGLPTQVELDEIMPARARLSAGPVAVFECFQKIPCRICQDACQKKKAVLDRNEKGFLLADPDLCNGCGVCVVKCPGQAIFILDRSYSEDYSLLRLPFAFCPLPEKGQYVCGLGRRGEEVGWFEVERIVSGGGKNKTWTVSIKVPHELLMEVRNIKAGGYK